MKLTNPTDEQLDAAVAEKVAGWRWAQAGSTGMWFLRAPDANTKDWHFSEPPRHSVRRYSGIDPFTRSADAVLPWLEKWKEGYGAHYDPNDQRYYVTIFMGVADAFSSTFPRAAVIALLRAHGVEVVFT